MLQLFDNKYPYTDFHELNLDWIISRIIQMDHKLTNFVSLNTIKYADPIGWNITKQYETNTVVMDSSTGIAYISSQPVPAGVSIGNIDYWSVIFDLQEIIGNINQNLTIHNNGASPTLLFSVNDGDWVLWNSKLYKALADLIAGTALIEDVNVKAETVEELTKEYTDALYVYIGLLSDLQTIDKSSIVNAINELVSSIASVVNSIGDLADLTTTDKTSIVNAINELVSSIASVVNSIGDLADLTTTDKTSIVNAINELVSGLSGLANNVGDLADLTTTDKTSIVNAINELVSSISGDYTTLNNKIDAETNARILADNNIINTIDSAIQSLPWKNIKDLGAKGSQMLLSAVYSTVAEAQVDYPFVTDLTWTFDSAALQKAITNYSLVYIPEGQFYFNKYAQISSHIGQEVWIRGAGRRLTYCNIEHDFFIYARSNRNTYCFSRFSDFTIQESSGARNQFIAMRFIGGYEGTTPTDHQGRVTIENVEFVYVKNAIDAMYTGQSVIDHCWFARCSKAFNFGRDVSFTKINNCIAEACDQFIQATDTLHDGLSNGLFFTNCQSVAPTGYDFAIEGYQAVYFTNCSSDLLQSASARGIWLIWCYDVSIQDCWIAGKAGVAGQAGVLLENCHSLHIAGCSFSNYARAVWISNQGIHDLGLVANMSICENKFEANVVDVFVVYGHFIIVSDNVSITNTATVIVMSDSDYNIVSNNIMYGTMTPNAGANSLVTNNIQSAR